MWACPIAEIAGQPPRPVELHSPGTTGGAATSGPAAMRYSDDHVLLHTQRDTRTSRFKAWVVFLVPLAAILFQVYIPLFFQFLAYLELPLIVTVYFALMRRSPIGGLLVGAIVGLAQDSLSKNPLGMFGITKTIIGYVAASVGLRPVSGIISVSTVCTSRRGETGWGNSAIRSLIRRRVSSAIISTAKRGFSRAKRGFLTKEVQK